MTLDEAKKEAARRWGRRGRAWEPELARWLGGVERCRVGFKPNLGRGRVGARHYRELGRGETWEAAFAAADAFLAQNPEARP